MSEYFDPADAAAAAAAMLRCMDGETPQQRAARIALRVLESELDERGPSSPP